MIENIHIHIRMKTLIHILHDLTTHRILIRVTALIPQTQGWDSKQRPATVDQNYSVPSTKGQDGKTGGQTAVAATQETLITRKVDHARW